MTLQELMPQLKELSIKEKFDAIEFLKKDLGIVEVQEPLPTYDELMELNGLHTLTEEERKTMDKTEEKVLELLEKYPVPERGYGIAGTEAGKKMMEYLEQRGKSKV